MELIKYTGDDHFAFDRNRKFEQTAAGSYGHYQKPNGMWVSVRGERDWLEWCRAEEFNLESLAHAWRVHLRENSGILHLEGADAIDGFTERFGMSSLLGSVMRDAPPAIDWPAVARFYPGIIIAPYVWSRRLYHKSSWYYGWDCASGCIWDLSIIESVERHVEVENAEADD